MTLFFCTMPCSMLFLRMIGPDILLGYPPHVVDVGEDVRLVLKLVEVFQLSRTFLSGKENNNNLLLDRKKTTQDVWET